VHQGLNRRRGSFVHKVSNFTGTALQVARFLAPLAKGILGGQPEDSELIGIMGVPFLANTLRNAHPPRAFTEIHGKVGIGGWGDGRYHDAAIVTVRSDVRYVMALLGSDGYPATPPVSPGSHCTTAW
jgi:hypothetical protein